MARPRPHWGKRISLRVSILASGSSGNCTLLETSQTRLLVDAGLSKRETLRRIEALGQTLDHLDGIVISHEHSDHIGGLVPMAVKKWHQHRLHDPRHARQKRFACFRRSPRPSRLQRVEFIEAGQGFSVGDIEVRPFAIPHDAADPIGFVFRADGMKVAIATDLGYVTQLVKDCLRGLDAVVLESNHDSGDAENRSLHPWHVKQRVMSRTGHLSRTTR